MTQTPTTEVFGTTAEMARDGAVQASYASPRLTLDARGDVVCEDRLSPSGALIRRRRFGPGQRLDEEECYAPGGALDYRIVVRHDGAGHVTEEVLSFGDGTPHGRWLHHRDPRGRLVRRDMVAPDGSAVVTETYTYRDGGSVADVERGGVASWVHRYDADGWLVRRRGGPYSGDELDEESIEFDHDDRHRLIRETAFYADGSVRAAIIIRYP
jgi:hypothetical protein